MKITFLKKKIIKKIENISRIINNNSYLISLRGILITVNEDNIVLIGSDGEISIKEVIEKDESLKIEETGKILIPGKLFNKILKQQSDEIKIFTKGKKLIINSVDVETKLNLLDIEEYPIISFDLIGKEVIFDIEKIKKIIKNVSYAAATNDNKRIILNGVNIESKGENIYFSATNSYRLSFEKVNIKTNKEFNITILPKNLREFIPSDINGNIKFLINDSKIITHFRNTIVVSKLIDGIYPKLSNLIPREFKINLEINKREIEELIEKVIVMCSEDNNVVKLIIKNKQLIFETKKNEIGSMVVKTDNFSLTNNNENEIEFFISFNIFFFKDAVSKIDNEKISINFNGSQKPFVVKKINDDNLIQLILPHKI